MLDTFMAVDLETTGLNPLRDRIIEVGAVKVVDGEEVSCFSRLIKQDAKLPPRIIQLTGIQDRMLLDASGEREVLQDFYEYAGGEILLGHNILFDYSFLKRYYENANQNYDRLGIDTLKLARMLHPDLGSRSLPALCAYYRIESQCAHRALEDAQAAGKLYLKMRERFSGRSETLFVPEKLEYRIKKECPATKKQKNYLLDLLKYHRIETKSLWEEERGIDDLTKSEASKIIDRIIFSCGRILR